MKYVLYSILFILISLSISCKKSSENTYVIPDSMKEYFAYQQGSYWIYKNDSTGLLDSTYVNSYYHNPDYNYGNGIKFEVIYISFHGAFLRESTIQYIDCAANECLRESSNFDTLSDLNRQDYYAYDPSLVPNIKKIPDCDYTTCILYKTIAHENINNTIYNNIIYLKIQSIDSSLTNLDYRQRELYFAKNIGLIKYFELIRFYNIRRSYSLLRHKVIQ